MICWHWRGTAFTVDFSFFAVAALVAVRGGALYFLLLFLACLLHELGHLAMLLLFHRHVQTVSLCGAGALFVPSAACGAYWQDILVSLAGPAVNLLLVYVFAIPMDAVSSNKWFLVGFWLAMNLLFFLYERLLGVAELLYVRKIEKRLRSVFKK